MNASGFQPHEPVMDFRNAHALRRMNYDPRLDGPQPIFSAPGVVVGLVVGLIAAYAGIVLISLFSTEAATNLVLAGAIIAARYGVAFGLTPETPETAPFPDDPGSLAAPFISHIFLHANLMHLTFNSLWLLVFGTPVARRLGAVGIFSSRRGLSSWP